MSLFLANSWQQLRITIANFYCIVIFVKYYFAIIYFITAFLTPYLLVHMPQFTTIFRCFTAQIAGVNCLNYLSSHFIKINCCQQCIKNRRRQRLRSELGLVVTPDFLYSDVGEHPLRAVRSPTDFIIPFRNMDTEWCIYPHQNL